MTGRSCLYDFRFGLYDFRDDYIMLPEPEHIPKKTMGSMMRLDSKCVFVYILISKVLQI